MKNLKEITPEKCWEFDHKGNSFKVVVSDWAEVNPSKAEFLGALHLKSVYIRTTNNEDAISQIFDISKDFWSEGIAVVLPACAELLMDRHDKKNAKK